MSEHEHSSTFLQGATALFLSDFSPGSSEATAISALRDAAKNAFLEVNSGLTLVEDKIRSRFVSEARILPEIADYLLELGGKRIRPILALLSAKLFGLSEPSAGLIDVAAGIELIHMATLLHDDIIDESPRRRHKESAYSKFGIAPSLLAGDFLWVRAFGLCAHLGELVVRKTEDACIELTEGEILEGSLTEERALSLKDYEQIVSKKTGSLFSLAAVVGSHYGGASDEEREALGRFGRLTGIAFQMIDDVLDVVADEDLLGKPSGTDLKQRTPSLVNVLWLESGDERGRQFFRSPIVPSPAEVHAALSIIRSSPVIEEARAIARRYAEEAEQELASVPSSRIRDDVRRHLLAILSYTLSRCL